MKKTLKTISNVATVLLFALSLFVIIRSTIAAKQNKPVFYFGYSFSVVITESMEPTINVNDIILYRKCPIEEVKLNDIIVFRSLEPRLKGSAITHRVVGITDDGGIILETKGDNNNEPDTNRVTKDNFYGIVISYGTALGLGKLINGNRSPIFLVIIFCFLILAVVEVKNIYVSLAKDKEEKIKAEMREQIMKEEGLLESEKTPDAEQKGEPGGNSQA